MKNTPKGALIIIASMSSILIITFIHDKIINLSIWISYPLILISFFVTLYGILKMYSKDASQEANE